MADAPAAAPSAPAPSGNISTAPPPSGAPPAPNTPGAPEAKPTPAWKPPPLKVYGQTREVDPDEYHRLAQHGAAFRHRSDELDKREAKFAADQKAALEAIEQDPIAYFQKRGLEAKKWAAQLLLSKAEEEQLTPEQVESKRLKAENEALKKAQQDREEAARAAEVKGHKERRLAQLGGTFVAALKEAGVPEGPVSWPYVEEIATYQALLDAAVERGEFTQEEVDREATPAILAKVAVENLRAADVVRWGRMPGAELLHAVPRDVQDRIIEARGEELERQRAGGQQAAPAPQAPKPNGANGRAQDPATGRFLDREGVTFNRMLGLLP